MEMDKSALRHHYRRERALFLQNLSAQAHNSILSQIQAHLLSLLPAESTQIGAFWPYGEEIDIRSLLYDLRYKKHGIFLPFATQDHRMTFHLWDSPWPSHQDQMHRTCADPQNPAIHPDFFIVPLLAFDEMNYRLGQGKGYYDRYFNALEKKFTSIGIAYEVQRCARLPHCAHDKALDFIVTEATIYRKK